MDDIAIRLDKVSKGFRLPHEKQSTLKGAIINFAKRGYEHQHVFDDLTLDIKKGEFLGIVGRNGSGKSTLLKTISGIYAADSGTVFINGKLTPFIELGVGFNPELSGRDNVYLNGALLGFSRKEIEKMYRDIVNFAELERFMDQKLKNYSSGMQVRLAFSIAIRANTDILVLDEVLAVGDEAFQRKCYDYFYELKRAGKTVILVTHDMAAVKRFCTRAIVLDKGKIIFNGDVDSAAETYSELNLKSTEESIKKDNKKRESIGSILAVRTTDINFNDKTIFKPHEKILLGAQVKFSDEFEDPRVQLWFRNPEGLAIASVYVTKDDFKKLKIDMSKRFEIFWELDGIFNDGKYVATVETSSGKTEKVYELNENAAQFMVNGWDSPYVIVHPKKDFKVKQ